VKTALVLVDIENDYFPGGKWELVGMDIAAFNAGRLLTAFRERKLTHHFLLLIPMALRFMIL
jgi:nicotinamidase-related amidase